MNMAHVVETQMYVAVDVQANSNKFYKVEILDHAVIEPGRLGKMETGHIRTSWGRVGAPKVESQLLNDDAVLAKKIREKTTRKDCPYSEVKTIGTASEATTKTVAPSVRVSSEQVKKAAITEIAGGCPVTAALIKKLAKTNRHELVAATGGLQRGGMDIDLETGLVRTALGVVTINVIKEARSVLDRMLPFVTKHDTDNMRYTDLLGSYLRLVPQDVGTRRRGWHTDFIVVPTQTSLLDQLETSVELAEQRMLDASKAPGQPPVVAPRAMFECRLKLVTDAVVWKHLNDVFFGTKNSAHRSVSSLKPVRAWEVTIPHHIRDFESHGRKVDNIKELWHGTRVFNCLSLLKKGYVLPGQLSSAQICGAMFGPYLYYSDQSSKSLNYARGGVWSSGVDSVCYMFYNDVAMGREYIPRSSCSRIPAGYDSIFAKAGVSGVMNNEMVIPHTYQVNPRYLIEFAE